MTWSEFTTSDDGPLIAGRRAGTGPPVLLLHGGPGLGFEYLRDLADELAQENDVAWYQQRGLAPSAQAGPYSVLADVEDARRVLDALGWQRAYVVGHSWGGHLALHVAKAIPERLLGALAVDPLGSVGDGRWAEFDAEMFRRTPEPLRERARELDEPSTSGAVDAELALEGLRLLWPAYFADPEQAPPMPELRYGAARSAEMMPSIMAELPALEAALPEIRVSIGFVHGSRSPMPLAASTDAAERIPGAWVEVVDGAGHFTWVEAPGAVPAALRRLTAREARIREFARTYTDAWCSHDPARVAAHYVPGGTIAINGGEPAEVADVVRSFMAAFPDIQVLMDDVVVKGETVEYHWTFTGTNTGSGGTGSAVRISGFEEWTFGDEGLVVRSRGHYDEGEYDRPVGAPVP